MGDIFHSNNWIPHSNDVIHQEIPSSPKTSCMLSISKCLHRFNSLRTAQDNLLVWCFINYKRKENPPRYADTKQIFPLHKRGTDRALKDGQTKAKPKPEGHECSSIAPYSHQRHIVAWLKIQRTWAALALSVTAYKAPLLVDSTCPIQLSSAHIPDSYHLRLPWLCCMCQPCSFVQNQLREYLQGHGSRHVSLGLPSFPLRSAGSLHDLCTLQASSILHACKTSITWVTPKSTVSSISGCIQWVTPTSSSGLNRIEAPLHHNYSAF